MTQMFDTAGLSRDGGRTVNMDRWASAEAKGLTCWVLADGLGGHANSQVASELAVETVLNGFRDKPRLDAKALTELFDMANAAVLAKQAEGPELRDIGTTLVVLISDGRRAVWGHVGDSRLYLLRLGGVATQTRDHAAPNGVLLKAIGSKQLKADISGPHRLFRHDAFMLCVDGFWEKLHSGDTAGPVEMEIDHAKATSAQSWLALLERRIFDRIDERSDNYTAVAVQVINRDLKLPREPGWWRDTRAKSHKWSPRDVAMVSAVALILAIGLGALAYSNSIVETIEYSHWKTAVNSHNLANILPFKDSENGRVKSEYSKTVNDICRKFLFEAKNSNNAADSFTLLGCPNIYKDELWKHEKSIWTAKRPDPPIAGSTEVVETEPRRTGGTTSKSTLPAQRGGQGTPKAAANSAALPQKHSGGPSAVEHQQPVPAPEQPRNAPPAPAAPVASVASVAPPPVAAPSTSAQAPTEPKKKDSKKDREAAKNEDECKSAGGNWDEKKKSKKRCAK
jgi:serine/threonine protein phosphatase PrpC